MRKAMLVKLAQSISSVECSGKRETITSTIVRNEGVNFALIARIQEVANDDELRSVLDVKKPSTIVSMLFSR